MIKLQYFGKFGRFLNLKNPKRFTEKLQYYKLHYKNPVMIECVDKYDVRNYVTKVGLSDILVPCIGVYNSYDEIEYSKLPNSFVLKDTLGSGGNSVIVIPDKNKINYESLNDVLTKWTSQNAHVKRGGREWPYYKGKNSRIIIEELLKTDDGEGLVDYKFFCFDGKMEFFYIMGDRQLGKKVSVSIYGKNKEKLDVRRVGDEEYNSKVEMPANIDEMIQVAERLSSEFPHVRVDLYNVNGKIYFGELTFFNASGYMEYDPDSFDYEIGEKFDIDFKDYKV